MKVVINIFGAPCVGKTHLAKQLAEENGWGCVSEYATHVIRSGKTELLANQPEITGGQLGWLQEALQKHDFVVTDSPCDLAYVYVRDPAQLPEVQRIVSASKEGVFVINVFLWHTDESIAGYTMDGRVHRLQDSLVVQDKISVMLAGGLTLSGLRDGVPYTFTPEGCYHISVKRGCDVKELGLRIRKEIGRQFAEAAERFEAR